MWEVLRCKTKAMNQVETGVGMIKILMGSIIMVMRKEKSKGTQSIQMKINKMNKIMMNLTLKQHQLKVSRMKTQ